MKLSQRDKLAKRLKRLRPENRELVLGRVDLLIDLLGKEEFCLPNARPQENMPLLSHELFFERKHSSHAFAFICIGFADDGDLSFGCSFGIREYAPPHNWHLSGNLGRRRMGILPSLDMGAMLLMPFKSFMFRRDWQFLISNVGDIVRFLETGEPNRHMAEVFVAEDFGGKL